MIQNHFQLPGFLYCTQWSRWTFRPQRECELRQTQ